MVCFWYTYYTSYFVQKYTYIHHKSLDIISYTEKKTPVYIGGKKSHGGGGGHGGGHGGEHAEEEGEYEGGEE